MAENVRRLAVARVRSGEKPSLVIGSYGLCRTTIYRWLGAEERGGSEALASTKASGRPPKLTEKQGRRVFRWINGKDPRQYGFDFGLWTRRIVSELILREFGVRLGVTAVGRLLHELGITPQKPLRRAYERDPVGIERWKRNDFPLLRARARERGAKIFFLDEAGVRSDQVLGKTWAPRGKTPEVATSGQRQSVNAISAVNARGDFWFEVYTERLNRHSFLRLLKNFLRGRRKPVFLVLDRHPAHIAGDVATFIQSKAGQLEFHFLPGYAPELNPDEFVWNHLKTNGVSKTPLHQGESLHRRVESDLHKLKRDRRRLRSIFQAPSVAYISD
jgi:transposase